MLLQEWVSLFEYFNRVATTKIPVEANTLTIMMHSDKHTTQHKRRKVYPGLPPDKEDKYPEVLHECLQGWFQHYTSYSDQTGEE